MRVTEIWRYPVKSLGGELLDRAEVAEAGIEGDRAYAIWDVDADLGLTARRVPELLFASAALSQDGSVQIKTADGVVAEDDAALSDWLGRRVELRSADAGGPRRYENLTDGENEGESPWYVFEGAATTFHDSDRARLSLLSKGTLDARGWDRRRFRANILLDGGGDRGLAGKSVRVGSATLRVGEPIGRCVMVTRPQPGGINHDVDVLRTIAAENGGTLAMAATVATAGTLAVGDELLFGD